MSIFALVRGCLNNCYCLHPICQSARLDKFALVSNVVITVGFCAALPVYLRDGNMNFIRKVLAIAVLFLLVVAGSVRAALIFCLLWRLLMLLSTEKKTPELSPDVPTTNSALPINLV